jgi:PAS domain S-box-containing protein
MMFIAGFDGYFKRVSPHFASVLGLSPEEMLRRPFLDFVHPDDRAATVAVVETLSAGAMTLSFENRYRCRDGGYVWLHWNAAPAVDEQLIFAAASDVTARRRAYEQLEEARAEAERANLAKSEFLSRMSHELRTPLNAILGFGQLLEMEAIDESQEESVRYILRGGRHLLDLINEVLDITRIESGDLALSVEPVALGDALADVLSLLRPVAEERGVRLRTELGALGERHVLADRQRLKQVLLNLASNAIKYNRRGGVATLSVEDTGDDHLRILVEDEGAGIPEEQLERLFVPFDRLGAEAGEVEGTGLGLALSERFVAAMGGTISVESTVGRGSTFSVELRAAEAPLARAGSDPELAAIADASRLAAGTILYIEDNVSNLRLVERFLAQHPHVRLIPAMQAGLGLELARRHLPDLILLDLHLPDMSGAEALERLQADPLTRGLAVVVLSADVTDGQVARLLEQGARDYLTKPLDVRRFIEVVGSALEDSKATTR